VGHGDHRAFVALEMVLQPGNGLGVEVVRGLVEQENIRFWSSRRQSATRRFSPPDRTFTLCPRPDSGARPCHLEPAVQLPGVQMVQFFPAPCLPLDELLHLVVGHGIGEAFVDLVVLMQKVDCLLYALFHALTHGLFGIELRLLLKEPDGVPAGEHRSPTNSLSTPAMMRSSEALARSVQAKDADLGAVEIGQVDVLQDRLLVVELPTPTWSR